MGQYVVMACKDHPPGAECFYVGRLYPGSGEVLHDMTLPNGRFVPAGVYSLEMMKTFTAPPTMN